MVEPFVDPSLRERPIAGSSRGKRKAKGGSSSGNAGVTSRRGRGRPRRVRDSDGGVTGDDPTDWQPPSVGDAYHAENSVRKLLMSLSREPALSHYRND